MAREHYEKEQATNKPRLSSLFKYPRLRKHMILMTLTW